MREQLISSASEQTASSGKAGKAWLALCIALYVAAFGYATVRGVLQPALNWDMVAYVGTVVSWETHGVQTLYERTMADVKQVVPGWYYKQITQTIPLSTTPEHFAQQLPIYRIKPLYVGLTWLTHAAGIAPTLSQATSLVSAASFAALALVLLYWKPRQLGRSSWLLALFALGWLGEWPLVSLARLSTPDALATLLLTAGVTALLKHYRALAAALLLLAVAARVESLLMVLMLAGFSFAFLRMELFTRVQAVLLGAGVAALYLLIQHFAQPYPYSTLFYYSFIHKTPTPAEYTGGLSWQQYSGVLKWGVQKLIVDARFQAMCALSLLAAFSWYMRPQGERLYAWLLVLAWANLMLRFVLYPAWGDTRYFYSNYLLMLISCAELLPPYFAALWGKVQRHRAEMNRPSP